MRDIIKLDDLANPSDHHRMYVHTAMGHRELSKHQGNGPGDQARCFGSLA